MATLELLPDTERVISAFLRADDDVAELAGERVYTAMPGQSSKDDTLVLLRRVGGEPPFTQPLIFERCELQVDVYGGPKAAAHTLARTVQRALAGLRGVLTEEVIDVGPVIVAVVSGVQLGAFRYVPDEVWQPPRPRYVFDATVYVKSPAGATGG